MEHCAVLVTSWFFGGKNSKNRNLSSSQLHRKPDVVLVTFIEDNPLDEQLEQLRPLRNRFIINRYPRAWRQLCWLQSSSSAVIAFISTPHSVLRHGAKGHSTCSTFLFQKPGRLCYNCFRSWCLKTKWKDFYHDFFLFFQASNELKGPTVLFFFSGKKIGFLVQSINQHVVVEN